MKILCFQRKRLPDCTRYTTPVIKHRQVRYGPVTKVEVIKRLTPVLITGPHDSGKTRWLRRLHDEAQNIWRKSRTPPLWLAALRPLSSWAEQDHVMAWWQTRSALLRDEGYEGKETRPWSQLRSWERVEALPHYLRDTGAVLFLDDCHKLTGRKLQIARECAISAKVFCATASDEQRIAPNLRTVLMRRNPQIIRLSSDVAYDASKVLIWLLSLLLLAAGAWEASLVVAGLQALASGRRAAKQDA